ncbi:hypothetical protein [Chryseobacterium contaminans]|uniref:hypothetical protein n=1 Tax=Chryseobacterium contaminans TaxID=1423959 RepID=UPI000F4E9000|nr:hypothetical protein [Chryseobacterium contaminans]
MIAENSKENTLNISLSGYPESGYPDIRSQTFRTSIHGCLEHPYADKVWMSGLRDTWMRL